MTFQVANGSIPALVERFLREALDVAVARVGDGWYVEVGLHTGRVYDFWRIAWPHDREPTLQEAIEALMAEPGWEWRCCQRILPVVVGAD